MFSEFHVNVNISNRCLGNRQGDHGVLHVQHFPYQTLKYISGYQAQSVDSQEF